MFNPGDIYYHTLLRAKVEILNCHTPKVMTVILLEDSYGGLYKKGGEYLATDTYLRSIKHKKHPLTSIFCDS